MQRRSGFNDATLEAVREAIDIVDLVSAHTRVERRGQSLVALCPFHPDKKPSMSVDPVKKLYYCFSCGAGGDALRFHMETTGDNFATAVEYLADRYGVPLPQSSDPEARARVERADTIQTALNLADSYFRSKLRLAPVPRQYLERRRISPGLVSRFGLGFAPDEWRALVGDLGRRVDVRDLQAAGLIAFSQKAPDRPYDRFRNRLMFPIRSPSGKLLGFGGRTLGDDQAKYVNTNETDQFRKGTVLYGLNEARRSVREQGRLLLVEGFFDVLGAVASGIDWVVASMGTALTEQQAALIRRYTEEVIVGYDGDRAGIEAARKAVVLLLGAGLSVRRAQFPAGQDPDSLRLDEGPEAVRKVVDEAADAVQLEVDSLPGHHTELDPRIRSSEAVRVKPLLDVVPDPLIRNGYYQQVAERLGVTVEELNRHAAPDERGRRPVKTPAAVATPSSRETAPDRRADRPPDTASIEEQALRLLLEAGSLDGVEWPRPAAFFDPELRAVYVAMREQAAGGAQRIDPDALYLAMRSRALIGAERLDVRGAPGDDAPGAGMQQGTRRPVDRFGEDLLGRLVPPTEMESSESQHASPGTAGEKIPVVLDVLSARYARQRIRVLVRDIGRADREGNREALHQMMQEKDQLSREIHGRAGSRWR